LNRCVEVVTRILELLPARLLQPFADGFMKAAQQFCLVHSLSPGEGQAQYFVAVRDLQTFLMVLASLSNYFFVEFEEKFLACSLLLHKVIELAVYVTHHRLHVQPSSALPAYEQMLVTLRAYTHWLVQFYTHCTQGAWGTNPQSLAQFHALLSRCLDLAGQTLLTPNVGERATCGAIDLLLSLSSTLRAREAVGADIHALHVLLRNAYTISGRLPPRVAIHLYVALSNFMLLPYRHLPANQQNWESRAKQYEEVIGSLVQPLSAIPSMLGEPSPLLQDGAIGRLLHIFRTLAAISRSIGGEGNLDSKAALYGVLQRSLPVCLSLFRLYVHHHRMQMVKGILQFFLVMFAFFRSNISASFIQETVGVFLSLLGDQLESVVRSNDEVALTVIKKFLKLLKLLMQDPGTSFQSFLPDILSFAGRLSGLFPSADVDPDILEEYYGLLFEMVLQHWNYFSIPQQAASLQFILTAFTKSFELTDINIFSRNIKALETLNKKVKLYQREYFVGNVRFPLLDSLFAALINRTHDLLREEINDIVYHLAAVHFQSFYYQYLPRLLHKTKLGEAQQNQLLQAFGNPTDLPSFVAHLTDFVNDLSCYS
jgi:hypothetical protein